MWYVYGYTDAMTVICFLDTLYYIVCSKDNKSDVRARTITLFSSLGNRFNRDV